MIKWFNCSTKFYIRTQRKYIKRYEYFDVTMNHKKKEERKIPKLSTNWFNFTSKMCSIERKEKWKRKEEQKEKKSRWLKVDQTWHYQRRLLSSFLSFKRHHNFFLFFIFSTIDIDIFECKSTLLTKNFSGFTIPRFIGRFYWWRCWYHDAKTNLTVSLIGKVNRIIKCGWAIALTFEFTLTYSSGVTLRTAFPPVRSGPSNYVYVCTRARCFALTDHGFAFDFDRPKYQKYINQCSPSRNRYFFDCYSNTKKKRKEKRRRNEGHDPLR